MNTSLIHVLELPTHERFAFEHVQRLEFLVKADMSSKRKENNHVPTCIVLQLTQIK